MNEKKDELRRAFQAKYASDATNEYDLVMAWAPGRVNIIGDHTDYNEGFVLPVTLEQAVYGMGMRRSDDRVRVYSLNYDQEIQSSLHETVNPGSGWEHYVRGVIDAVHAGYGLSSGFDAVLLGEVPIGSGLSSSAAIEVAVLLLLQGLYGLDIDPVDGAFLCQKVEHDVIGMHCGIMDQFASRLGRERHALFLDCRSLQYEEVPMELGTASLLIVDSKAPRSLAASKYNERRQECESGVAVFQEKEPGIQALRDVTPYFFGMHEVLLAEPVRSRCRHVVYENERVKQAVQAMRSGDVVALGALMTASHESLRNDYAVSVPELDFLVAEACGLDGVYGARLTGAGFGGCVVALAESEVIPSLKSHLASVYARAFGQEPAFLDVKNNIAGGWST